MPIYDSQGQIKVQPGDCISKYHMAIKGNYGNQASWEANFRIPPASRSQEPPKLKDYNKIEVGQTIIYLPEWNKNQNKKPGVVIPVPATGPLTQEELDELLGRLHTEAGLGPMVARKFVEFFGTWVDRADFAMSVSELIESTVQYMDYCDDLVGSAESTPGLMGPAVSFLGILFFQIGGFIAWVDARRAGMRYVTLRAMAFGITSFTYDDPAPPYPSEMARNLPGGPVTDPTLTVQDFRNEWDLTVSKVRAALDGIAARKGVPKAVVQCGIGFTSEGKQKLTENMMTKLEYKYLSSMALPFVPPYVIPSVHDAFWSPYPNYPYR